MNLNLEPKMLIGCIFLVCLGFVYLMVRIMYGGKIKIDESIGRTWYTKVYSSSCYYSYYISNSYIVN
ncbi:MAG: hypothetical protein J6A15_03605 [Clostridia bacterium]|nr:hypothetical protein [Clostridia bacterium]